MAPVFDAASSAGGSGAGPFTWSHTCSGSDRLLIVGVSHYDSVDTISAITYNGVAMTAVPSGATNNGQYYTALYYLINPASGSNTISITYTGSVSEFGGGGVSFTAAHQTVPLGTAATATGSSTTPSVNVSSAADEIVADNLVIIHGGTLTVGASQTQHRNATAGGFIKYAGSTETGAGTTTMSWSNSTSQTWAIAAVPVKPTAAAGTPVPVFMHHLQQQGIA